MNDITAAIVTSSRIEALGGLLVIDAQGASGFLCQRRTRSGKDHSKGDGKRHGRSKCKCSTAHAIAWTPARQ
jgi:hypothetical protein